MADEESPDDFEKLAAEDRGVGLVGEFLEFLRYNKKWWLLPILIVLLGIGALLAIGSGGAAPFIYPLW